MGHFEDRLLCAGTWFSRSLEKDSPAAFCRLGACAQTAVGDPVLELREYSGEPLGDLRYNFLYYDDSENTAHGILGYAPSVTNPRTGEILKADVILYGKVLKRAVFQELFWEKSRRPAPTDPSTEQQAQKVSSRLEASIQALRSSKLFRSAFPCHPPARDGTAGSAAGLPNPGESRCARGAHFCRDLCP